MTSEVILVALNSMWLGRAQVSRYCQLRDSQQPETHAPRDKVELGLT